MIIMVDTTTLIALVTAVPALMTGAAAFITSILNTLRSHTHSAQLLDVYNKIGAGAQIDQNLAKQIDDHKDQIKQVIAVTAQLSPTVGQQIATHEAQLKHATDVLNSLTTEVATLKTLVPK